jgi:hypothetical protein
VSSLKPITARTMLEYTAKTGTYTAKFFDDVFCDTSGGAFTITIPSAATRRKRVRIYLTASAAGLPLTIGRNGNNINGVAADLIPDGSGWWVGPHNYTPHFCFMRRETSQTGILDSTSTKITSLSTITDVLGLADTGNNRINILRTGRYLYGLNVRFQGVIDAGETATVNMFVNGSNFRAHPVYSAAAAGSPSNLTMFGAELNAGDYCELYCSQASGGTQATSAAADQVKPVIFVQEQL